MRYEMFVILFFAVLVAGRTVPEQERNVGDVAKEKCQGFRKVSAGINQILGGKIAVDGEFPYMAALGVRENGNFTFTCGASLISTQYLLTASHCYKEKSPTVARFGVVNLFNPIPNDPPVDIELNDAIFHTPKHKNDIALVQLKRPVVEFFIVPICLYTEPEDPEPELNLTIAGWGINDPNGEDRFILMKGENVNVWSQENCTEAKSKPRSRLGPTLENMICASKLHSNGSTEVDSCHGDSGGPLELVQNRRRYLVGITAKGVNCGSTLIPGYYTRVANYIGWIESIVWPREIQYSVTVN